MNSSNYDVTKPVMIQGDVSQEGLGACLLQNGHPIAYCSMMLENYVQIEKEMLMISFAMKKFHQYIYGKLGNLVQTDHKPLESILKKLMLRLQRLMLTLQPYDLVVSYVPGNQTLT